MMWTSGSSFTIISAHIAGDTVVLQKITWDTNILNVTSVQAATLKRSATNLTCPRMSPFPIPSICPFRIMFMAS